MSKKIWDLLGSERFVKIVLVGLVLALLPTAYVREAFFSTVPGQPFNMEGTFERVDVGGYTIGFTKHNFHSNFALAEGYTPSIGGGWNGPLPPRGTRVAISSPTGLMRNVVITETDSGKIYKSQGLSLWPDKQPFEYRVTLRATGDVLCEGEALGFDSFDATDNARCKGMSLYKMSFSNTWVVQIWEEGAAAPPYLKP